MGTFFIYYVSYFALIYIGSTHSYIANTVFVKLNIYAECTDSEVSVVSALGQSILVDKVYKHVPLENQGIVFQFDLMELLFGEFGLILRMD